MQFGVDLPNIGPFSDANFVVQLAQQAESAGWDGFFLWDHVAVPDSMVDTMTVCAAIAVKTERLRFGPMITGPARRRPWKLAREATTIDHLSGGRFVLGVGLGASSYDFDHVGDEPDPRIRAQRMDEALDIIARLWTGETVTHHGGHFQVEGLNFRPTPIQQPRIPIWIAGWYPNKAPMRRAARWDGVFPLGQGYDLTPDQWREILTFVHGEQAGESEAPFDAIHTGITPDDPALAAQFVRPYAEAGVTWWLEDISPVRVGLRLADPWPEPWETERIISRIFAGPPQP